MSTLHFFLIDALKHSQVKYPLSLNLAEQKLLARDVGYLFHSKCFCGGQSSPSCIIYRASRSSARYAIYSFPNLRENISHIQLYCSLSGADKLVLGHTRTSRSFGQDGGDEPRGSFCASFRASLIQVMCVMVFISAIQF